MMPNQLLQILQQFKSNPMQFLMQRRFNLPQGMSMNDPNEILNHLIQTGQISQQQINSAYQAMQRFQR